MISKIKSKISNLSKRAKIFYFGFIPLTLISTYIYIAYHFYYQIKKSHPGHSHELYLEWALKISLQGIFTILIIIITLTTFAYLTYKLILKIYGLFK